MQKGKTINELKLGDTASFTKIITEEDVNLFAKTQFTWMRLMHPQPYFKRELRTACWSHRCFQPC